MKQGSGKSLIGGGKVEPRSHAVSVDKVSTIGVQVVRVGSQSKELYTGKGYKAPAIKSQTTSNRGSQGRH